MDGFGLEAEARMTTWHIMIPSDIEPDGGYSQDISEGSYLNFSPFSLHSFLRYNQKIRLQKPPTLTTNLSIGRT